LTVSTGVIGESAIAALGKGGLPRGVLLTSATEKRAMAISLMIIHGEAVPVMNVLLRNGPEMTAGIFVTRRTLIFTREERGDRQEKPQAKKTENQQSTRSWFMRWAGQSRGSFGSGVQNLSQGLNFLVSFHILAIMKN